MKLNGEVTTGLGKAAFFLSQDFYVNNFINWNYVYFVVNYVIYSFFRFIYMILFM